MEFHTFQLSNGIRVIHKQTDREVSHCGLIINSGSRDELEHQQGLAHFIEHSIFKGTQKRKTFHILSRLDSVGAEINAYTTKEETWVYASYLEKHLDRAVELIADICFNSTFPEKEIEKEKDVIIDEINSYMDAPGEMIFDDFEEQLYAGHPIGRNILGTVDSVRSLGREDIFEMQGRRYRTNQMVFSSVGPSPVSKVKRICEKYLNTFTSPEGKEDRAPFEHYKPLNVELNKDTYQVHYLLGNVAYHNGHKNKTGLILLNNILGGPAMNSRLNLHIREKHGMAYNIESNYSSYSDTGIFQVYLGTDDKFFAKAEKLVHAELKKLRDKELGTSQLHMAKQQLIGQVALNQDSGSGTMLALGKSYLLYDKVDSIEEVYSSIENLTSSQLLEIANEVFDPAALSRLVYRKTGA
ncbi:MAG: pitrilysin family protein [Flavobacteriales bacterium]|nr:pitrilysin family protein [Flavobacteriales bacterium]